jgi:ComF family protein
MVTSLKNASLQVFRKISHLILSPTCCVCHGTSDTANDLCRHCHSTLPWLTHTCQCCALPLATDKARLCGQCLKKPPAYQQSLSLFHYQAPIANLINQLKFQHRLVASHVLAQLLSEKVQQYYQQQTLPELIIPIPLHKKRLQQRGFNQALELARIVSKKRRLPINSESVQRTRNTAQQSQLPATERAANVRNVFIAEGELPKHVAIVDDVVTTGNTVQAMSLALQHAGVERIDVWSIARPTL